MRAVHFCKTCDFRLPYCVRSDRKFCGRQCRGWWNRHPGHKRPDFSPGGGGLPDRPGHAQPRTLAEARAALAETRAYAAELEATARSLQIEDRKLRDTVTALRDALSSSRVKSTEEGEALMAQLEAIKQRFESLEKQELATSSRTKELEEEKLALVEQLKQQDELRGKLESAERTVAQRDDELKQQRQQLATVERAHKEVHLVAESEWRSLREEKTRRVAAEQRVEQLTLELEALAKETIAKTFTPDITPLLRSPISALLEENREVRGQRDRIDAERELLAARLLEWMSPGQYLEHAASADYDISKDPLIQIKMEEIRIDNERFRKQVEANDTKTARPLDPKQTVVEQAYAAALSARWGIKHKPHKRHRDVEWSVIGFVLDEKSEEYLMKIAQRRIDWMKRKQGESALPGAHGFSA